MRWLKDRGLANGNGETLSKMLTWKNLSADRWAETFRLKAEAKSTDIKLEEPDLVSDWETEIH